MKNSLYELIKIFIPKTTNKIRNNILYKIIEDNKAIGLMEQWIDTSILYKPKEEFLAILIIKSHAHKFGRELVGNV